MPAKGIGPALRLHGRPGRGLEPISPWRTDLSSAGGDRRAYGEMGKTKRGGNSAAGRGVSVADGGNDGELSEIPRRRRAAPACRSERAEDQGPRAVDRRSADGSGNDAHQRSTAADWSEKGHSRSGGNGYSARA